MTKSSALYSLDAERLERSNGDVVCGAADVNDSHVAFDAIYCGCGCGFGCAQTDWGAGENPQDVLFNCVEFASVECSFDVSSCTGERCVTYGEALEAFGQCAQTGSTAGYCRGSLASAAFLRNQDVCEGPAGGPASNSNIGFRAPPYACAVSFYPSQTWAC